ncbi:hypothetical protein QQS21_005477 [Conoideocrella luteorostrata]|uniref:Aminoglycoside phosphotransferase domain-containing protein n=1 Tax=Conoideocrella luteorostrata TaxID=1105319 RepID=A0AAJ0CPK4_9HYPO|nr:hypothetical protein QQS21_005477 [Conoideocrella luteorostrata]
MDSTDWPFNSHLVGGMHAHVPIQFANGSTWLARMPRHNFTSFSDQLSNAILLQECATLKWLETAKIPAPRLHAYGLRGDANNNVGVAFMLIDKLPGRPLSQLTATDDQMRKVYAQLGSIFTMLSRHPFDRIGSLTLGKDETIQIGPVMGDRTGTLSCLGLFQDATSYYVAWVNELLRLIASRQIFARFSSHAYMMFKYLGELAADGSCNGFEAELDAGPYFLKHMDDKGDHILVDEDFNMTGIIDWSFARLVPAYEAFGPSLVTANMSDVFSGRLGLSDRDHLLADALEARGSPLARFARSADRVRRFTFGLGVGMSPDLSETQAIFRGIVLTFNQGSEFSWEQWRREHILKWSDDEVLGMLLREDAAEGPGVHDATCFRPE